MKTLIFIVVTSSMCRRRDDSGIRDSGRSTCDNDTPTIVSYISRTLSLLTDTCDNKTFKKIGQANMFSFNWRYEKEFLLIWIQLTWTFKSIETFLNCCQGPVHYERNTLRLAYLLINTTGYSLGFIQHFGAEPYPQSTRWWTSNRDLAREIFLCCWGGLN